MNELVRAIPDVEMLLSLSAEELGAKMLFLLRTRGEQIFSLNIETLVHGESMYWLRADRMGRVALRPRHRHPQSQGLAASRVAIATGPSAIVRSDSCTS